mmetsp:Transcript_39699/g.98139  ORF Transcript_39699/g.98139 Transcript_39699/m.98139 type:complete len:123 (-) Transcript_39699:253-621(-)
MAVGAANGTAILSLAPPVPATQSGGGPTSALELRETVRVVGSGAPARKADTKGVAVPMIDLGDFLRRHVRPVNFVVVKLDVEDSEWAIIPTLLAPFGDTLGVTGGAPTASLIDELFFECHTH